MTNKFKWDYSRDKCRTEEDLEPRGSSLYDSDIPTQEENMAKNVKLKTRQKLHWGYELGELILSNRIDHHSLWVSLGFFAFGSMAFLVSLLDRLANNL